MLSSVFVKWCFSVPRSLKFRPQSPLIPCTRRVHDSCANRVTAEGELQTELIISLRNQLLKLMAILYSQKSYVFHDSSVLLVYGYSKSQKVPREVLRLFVQKETLKYHAYGFFSLLLWHRCNLLIAMLQRVVAQLYVIDFDFWNLSRKNSDMAMDSTAYKWFKATRASLATLKKIFDFLAHPPDYVTSSYLHKHCPDATLHWGREWGLLSLASSGAVVVKKLTMFDYYFLVQSFIERMMTIIMIIYFGKHWSLCTYWVW